MFFSLYCSPSLIPYRVTDSRLFILFSKISELNINNEQEKAQLLRSYQAERESLLREQEQERVRSNPSAPIPFLL